jgi:hypothetical protein
MLDFQKNKMLQIDFVEDLKDSILIINNSMNLILGID